MTKTTTRQLSDSHKAALAEGREQGNIVKRYLTMIDQPTRRGRKPSIDTIRKRRDTIVAQLAASLDPMKRLQLIQARIDLDAEIDAADKVETIDPDAQQAITDNFIAVAAAYGERKGLTYAAWRSVGVPAKVLKAAGIPRTN